MKNLRLMISALLVSLTLFSCQKTLPTAFFTTDKETYTVNEKVGIINQSHAADTYSWLAGSNSGTDFNFAPSFILPGIYNIELIVTNKDGADTFSKSITVVEKTTLKVHTASNNANVADCSIKLYDNYEDWYNEQNAIETGKTDAQGNFIFTTDITAKDYFISAVKPVADNYLTNWTINQLDNYKISITEHTENLINTDLTLYFKSGYVVDENTSFLKDGVYYSVQ